MSYTSNSNALLARLKAVSQFVETGDFSDALVAGLNAGIGIMKRRIFNQSLAADNTSLGPYYSEQYERDRVRRGRQVFRKDLEFHGSLRRSIEVVAVNNTRAECRITNEKNAQIARYQEQQVYNLRNDLPANEASGGRVPIFEFSTLENEIANSTTLALLQQKFTF
jgi:hypothetical protein